MEQVATQVTDLRYLAEVPVPLPTDSSAAVAATFDGQSQLHQHQQQQHHQQHHQQQQQQQQQQQTPQTQHNSPGSASLGDNSANVNANKRKSFDDGGSSAKQTRSKRNRYISIACNECKRRKIKCNGQTPCQRCGNLNLACLYAPNCCSTNFKETEEFRRVTEQLNSLQNEVNWLNQTVRALQPDASRPTPALEPQEGEERAPLISSAQTVASPQSTSSAQRPDFTQVRNGSFRGPTSLAYSLDVANNTMSGMGYKGIMDNDVQIQAQNQAQAQTQAQSQAQTHLNVPNHVGVSVMDVMHGNGDPLLDYDKDEMIRLCQLHEAEVGIMYPVLEMQSIIEHAKNLSPFLVGMRHQRPIEFINDEKTLQLKIVMCCALVVEEHGHSEKAMRLFESMEAVLNRKLMGDVSDPANTPILALLAGYRFLSNDEILAWRIMGQVIRLCVESGLHQREGLMRIEDEQQRKNALISFWTAFVLDRRWAFGTGLPYTLRDEDVDPQLPMPDEYPFLVAMVSHSKICAKVWRQINQFGPVLARELRHEELERLDEEILEWYESVPEEVKVRNWDQDGQMVSTPSYNLQRLRIWTYLRYNQVRIWLYTPILHSATSIMANPIQAQRVVDLAKDTIRYLHHLNNTTNLYRRLQVFYHQFLTSAISAVFLASVHAPVRFSAVCREEFYLALELVRDLAAKSWVSHRLWKTIRALKDVAPRFGLNPEDDAHSTAALGMIGLARGHVASTQGSAQQFPRSSVPAPGGQAPGAQSLDQNGVMIQSEMSRIFEGYVGLNGVQQQSRDGEDDEEAQSGSEMQTPDSLGENDATVFPHMKEMF